MTAIVTGNGLGLTNSSLGLGAQGQMGAAEMGKDGERVYVNAATGNLVVQDQDEWLVGLGPDVAITRTYNSQSGSVANANVNHNWRLGYSRKVQLPLGSTPNTPNSTVMHVAEDGSETTYSFNLSRGVYVGNEGQDALDTLRYDESSQQWTWTDGATQVQEHYDTAANGGRLKQITDPNGHKIALSYSTDGLIDLIKDDNGETVQIEYDANRNLKDVLTTYTNAQGQANQLLRRVSYAYTTGNRLQKVKVALGDYTMPGSNLTQYAGNITDTTYNTYTTTYAYVGDTDLIASIKQSDGSQLTFTYDGQRVKTIKQLVSGSERVTTLDYSSVDSGEVTVTDAKAGLTTIRFDVSTKRLLSIEEPNVAGVSAGTFIRPKTQFSYDPVTGNVATVQDARGNTTTYRYGNDGNCGYERDASGHVITRAFDSRNRVLIQTVYTQTVSPTPSDPWPVPAGGAQITRYAYDDANLRFVISPEGRVTEYRYENGISGQLSATIKYAGDLYPVNDWDSDMAPQLEDMTHWLNWLPLTHWAAVDRTQTERTDYHYDARGQLQTQTTYASVGIDGSGVASTQAVTHYIYDQSGNLLQSIDARHGASDGNHYITTYAYDGLNRLSWKTDGEGHVTEVVFAAISSSVYVAQTTLADGSYTTSYMDRGGRVYQVKRYDSNGDTAGLTSFTYDLLNRLVKTTDPSNVSTYQIYDADGRKVADISGASELTQYDYNAAGQLVRTTAYANRVTNTAALASPTSLTLAAVKPAVDLANDRVTRNVYDAAGRLQLTIDAVGAVAEYRYDGAGRLTDARHYASRLSSNQLATLDSTTGELMLVNGLITLPTATGLTTVALPTPEDDDRNTRQFYSADGLLLGSLDALGTLTRHTYDGAGRLTQTIRYATPTDVLLRQSGTLSELTPAVAPDGQDQTTHFLYNARGQLIGVRDAETYYTEYRYDAAGNKSAEIRYANYVRNNFVSGIAPQIIAAGATAPTNGASYILANTEDRTTQYLYDANNRLLQTTSLPDGAITSYTYDALGNLIETREAVGKPEQRTALRRYDSQGRVTGELGGVGSAKLAALVAPDQAAIDSVWRDYGTTYQYDLAGRRIATITPSGQGGAGNKTVYYYDADSRLTYSINALGEVTQYSYNAFGDQLSVTRYGKRITSAASLASLTGGLDTDTQLIAALDGLGNAALDSITRALYDQRGLATRVTDALQHAINRTYSTFGQLYQQTETVVSDTTQKTLRTLYYYNQAGQLFQAAHTASGVQTQWVVQKTYDAFGRLITSADENFNSTSYQYDHLGRQIQVTGPSGETQWVDYDAFGRELTIYDTLTLAAYKCTTFEYDTAQNKVTVTTPAGVKTTTVTNHLGQTVSVTDGRDDITTYTYDQDGHITDSSVTAKGGSSALLHSHTEYDKAGRVFESKDGNNVVTRTTYDAASRVLTQVVDPGTTPTNLNLTTQYLYDAKGQAVWRRDANQVWTQTEYDLQGQVKAVTVDPAQVPDLLNPGQTQPNPAGSAALKLRTEFTFDTQGHTLTVAQGVDTAQTGVARYAKAQVSRYTYDVLGRRIKEVVAPTRSPLWTSGADDNPTGLNLTTAYAYDAGSNVVTKTVDANGLAYRTRYVYNANKQVIYTVDATGAVTHNEYDASGHLTRTSAYATTIKASDLSALPLAASDADVTTALTMANATYATNSANQVQINTYNLDGRLTYTVDALNHVTLRQYDEAGNVVKLTRFANATTTPAVNTSLNQGVAGAVSFKVIAPPPVTANDQVEQYVYDGANRLAFKIDAEGYVTQNTYDANSNLTQVTRYAKALKFKTTTQTTISTNAAPKLLPPPGIDLSSLSSTDSYIVTDAANDQTTTTYYDKVNRATSSVDAEGYLTQRRYDNNGHLTLLTRYGAKLSNLTTLSATTEPQVFAAATTTGLPSSPYLLRDSANDATTQYLYDQAGRLTDTTEAFGTTDATTTHQAYDAAGRVTDVSVAWGKTEQSTTHYLYDGAGRVTDEIHAYTKAEQTTTHYTLDGLGNRIKITDPNGNSGYFYFNANNQAIWHIDPLGYAVKTDYNAFGQVTTITKYANAVQNLGTLTTAAPPAVYSGAQLDTYKTDHTGAAPTTPYILTSANDGTTSIEHDKLGNQTQITDAAGFFESTTYDAFNNKKTYTAKSNTADKVAGGTYSYTYDRNGRLKTETLPDTVNQLNLTTGAIVYGSDGKPAQVSVVNVYDYDARGNRTKSVEAQGLYEQRTTEYKFDKLDRQVSQTGEAITTYVVGVVTAPGVIPTETRKYDARGNLIEEIAADGARTLTFYDALNRKTAQLQATTKNGDATQSGTLATFDYNGSGDLVLQRVYANSVLLPAVAGGARPSGAGTSRETRFGYDANHNLLSTTVVGVVVGEIDPTTGNYAVKPGQDLKSLRAYDRNGNAITETDARNNQTWHVFDATGNEAFTIDAERYVTYREFDGSGQITRETHYANKLPDTTTLSASLTRATLISVMAGQISSDDRTTEYVRDKLGRVLQQSVKGLVSAKKIVASGTTIGQLDVDLSVATTQFEYNGLGLVTKKTLATGDVLNWKFDQQGRATESLGAVFTDSSNDINAQQITDTEYNGLGLIERNIERGKTATAETDDRITLNSYGKNGLLVATTDAAGTTTTYQYDAAGHQTLSSVNRANADGVSKTDINTYTYDLGGRQTKQQTYTLDGANAVLQNGSPYAAVQSTRADYDAYGSVINRYVNGTLTESATFDAAGRVVKTTSGGGAPKVYLYDANGNVTLTLTPPANDQATAANSAASNAMAIFTGSGAIESQQIQAALSAGAHASVSIFDRRNQQIDTYELAASQVLTNPTGVIAAAGAQNPSITSSTNTNLTGAVSIGGDVTISYSMSSVLSVAKLKNNDRRIDYVDYHLIVDIGQSFLPGDKYEILLHMDDGFLPRHGYGTIAGGDRSFPFISSTNTTNRLDTTFHLTPRSGYYLDYSGIAGQSFHFTVNKITNASAPDTGKIMVGQVSGSLPPYATDLPAGNVGLSTSGSIVANGQNGVFITGQPANTSNVCLIYRLKGTNTEWHSLTAQYSSGVAKVNKADIFYMDILQKVGEGVPGELECKIIALSPDGKILSSQTGSISVNTTYIHTPLYGDIDSNAYLYFDVLTNKICAKNLPANITSVSIYINSMGDESYSTYSYNRPIPSTQDFSISWHEATSYTTYSSPLETPFLNIPDLNGNGPNFFSVEVYFYTAQQANGISGFFTTLQPSTISFESLTPLTDGILSQAGPAYASDGKINYIAPPPPTGGGAAQSAKLRYREVGTSNWTSAPTPLAPATIAGAASPGWFQINPSTYGLTTGHSYEYLLDLKDAANGAGNTLNTVFGRFTVGNADSVTVPVLDADRATSVHFTNVPLNATQAKVTYTIMGETQVRTATLRSMGNGDFDWDTSDVALNPNGNYVLDYSFQALDANNAVLSTFKGRQSVPSTSSGVSVFDASINSLSTASGDYLRVSPNLITLSAPLGKDLASASTSLPNYIGDGTIGALRTVGTFNASAPAGKFAVSATISGTFGVNLDSPNTAPLEVYADGIRIAIVKDSTDPACTNLFDDPIRWSYTFSADELHCFDDGQVVITQKQTAAGNSQLGSLNLAYSTASPIPRAKLYYRPAGTTQPYQSRLVSAVSLDVSRLGAFNIDLSDVVAAANGTTDLDVYYEYLNSSDQVIPGYKLPTADKPVLLRVLPQYQYQAATSGVSLLINGATNDAATSHRHQSFNAFGEVAQELGAMAYERIHAQEAKLGRKLTDAEASIYGTTLQYNTQGLLTSKTDAQTQATLESGYQVTQRATTTYAYDLQGRQVGQIDANGNLTTYLLRRAGEGERVVAQEFRPAYGNTKYEYDVFGDLRRTTVENDDLDAITDYSYDANHRVIRTDQPAGAGGKRATQLYRYDSAGNRITHITSPDVSADANNNFVGTGARTYTDRTYYDGLGRVVSTLSAEGLTTSTAYSVDGAPSQRVNVDNNGKSTTDLLDAAGRMIQHTDQSGRSFKYEYNLAGNLIHQFRNDLGTNNQLVGEQDIRYTYYSDGTQRSIDDQALRVSTYFEYDKNGNKTFEGETSLDGKNIYQRSSIAYDELNRITSITDTNYSLAYEYDKAGNRRHVLALKPGQSITQDYWYSYDSLNRIAVSMGVLTGGRATTDDGSHRISQGTSGDGVRLTYDKAGNRKTAAYAKNSAQETYFYTADGFLTQTQNGTGGQISNRTNDLLGRVTNYVQNNAIGTVTQSYTYDQDGRVVTSDSVGGGSTTHTINSYNLFTFDSQGKLRLGVGTKVGALQASDTQSTPDGGKMTHLFTKYTYAYLDSAQQAEIKVQADSAGIDKLWGKWAPGLSKFAYDVNGHVTQVSDSPDGGNFNRRTLNYVNNAQGQILSRYEAGGNIANPMVESYFYINGHLVGESGNTPGQSSVNYSQALLEPSGGTKDRFRNPGPITANFDQNYQPINATYPSFVSSGYTVQNGDTLESIARSVWGDASLWYLIADANNLAGNSDLDAGEILVIPNKVTNIHNNSQTFKVYNPSEAMGDTAPTVPDAPRPPPPPSKGGCGGVGMILMVVVAVVASVFTAGAALGALAALAPAGSAAAAAMTAGMSAALTSGSMAAVAAGVAASAVGAAVGSIASQLVGMATGDVQKFSWSAVTRAAGSGALAAGVSAGASYLGLDKLTTGFATADKSLQAARNFAAVSAVRGGFSWKGVATAAVGGALSSYADTSDFGNGLLGEKGGEIFRGTVAGVAAGGARSLIFNETPHWQSIAAGSFGGAVGGALSPWASSMGQQLGDEFVRGIVQGDSWAAVGSGLKPKGDVWADKQLNLPNSPLDDASTQLGMYGLGSSPGQAAPRLNQVGMDTTTDTSTAWKNWDEAVAKVDALEWRAAEKARVQAEARARRAEQARQAAAIRSSLDMIAGADGNGALPLLGGGGNVFTAAATAADQRQQAQARQSLSPGLLYNAMAYDAPDYTMRFVNKLFGLPVTGTVETVAVVADNVSGLYTVARNELGFGLDELPAISQSRRALQAGMDTSEYYTRVNPAGNILLSYADSVRAYESGDWSSFADSSANLVGGTVGLLFGARAIASPGAGALRSIGVPDWNIRLRASQPGTLYSNPVPFELERVGNVGTATLDATSGTGKFGRFGDAQTFADEAFSRYQRYTDDAYTAATKAYENGRLVVPDGMNADTIIGQRTDAYARIRMSRWFKNEGIAEGPGETVQLNRWLRDPGGSGNYRVPDVSIPDANLIMDGTIGFKWQNTPQVLDFRNFSGGSNITIVRPTQLGGSYSLLPLY